MEIELIKSEFAEQDVLIFLHTVERRSIQNGHETYTQAKRRFEYFVYLTQKLIHIMCLQTYKFVYYLVAIYFRLFV